MAEIPQYQAQPGDVAGPIETARQARPEDVNIGGGLERLGAGVSSAGDAIERRAKQEDLIAAHTSTSRIGSAMQAQAKDAIANYQQVKDPATGAVDFAADAKQRQDMEENFRQQLNDQLDKAGDAIQTEFGKKYFSIHRDNTFTQSMSAFHNGMAQLAAKNGTDQINEQHRLDATDIAANPKIFGQKNADHAVFIKAVGEASGLKPWQIQEQIDKDAKENAFAAIDGWARTVSPQTAKAMLDSRTYDSFLSQKDKEQLYTHVEQIQKANNYDQDRMDRQQEKAQKEMQTKTWGGFLTQLESPNAPPDLANQIVGSTTAGKLTPQMNENLFHLMDAKKKEQKWSGDPVLYAKLAERANLPWSDPNRLRDNQEIINNTGFDKLNPSQAKSLLALSRGEGTLEGESIKDMKRRYLETGKNLIFGKDEVGAADPDKQFHYAAFIHDTEEAFNKGMQTPGLDPHSMFNPHDKQHYLGKNLGNYVTDWNQRYTSLINKVTGSTRNTVGSGNASPQSPDMFDKASSFIQGLFHKGGK